MKFRVFVPFWPSVIYASPMESVLAAGGGGGGSTTPSSLRILPMPLLPRIVAPVGLERMMRKLSSPSTLVSPFTVIEMVLVASPFAKLSVPLLTP